MRKRPVSHSKRVIAGRPLPAWLRNRWVALGFFLVLLALSQGLKEYQGGGGRTGGPVPGAAVPGEAVVGKPRLVDGDSFHLAGEEVRLVGIDAPEGRQNCTRDGGSWPCGEESRRKLAQLIGAQPISCKARERDQHGRLLAVCSVGSTNLNREMVASGMALAYGNYQSEESEARRSRRGLWSGEFERPRDWRGHNR